MPEVDSSDAAKTTRLFFIVCPCCLRIPLCCFPGVTLGVRLGVADTTTLGVLGVGGGSQMGVRGLLESYC